MNLNIARCAITFVLTNYSHVMVLMWFQKKIVAWVLELYIDIEQYGVPTIPFELKKSLFLTSIYLSSRNSFNSPCLQTPLRYSSMSTATSLLMCQTAWNPPSPHSFGLLRRLRWVMREGEEKEERTKHVVCACFLASLRQRQKLLNFT